MSVSLSMIIDCFLSEKMVSDPSKLYDDAKLEEQFVDWCDNKREIYDRSRRFKRECKGYFRGSIKDAPPSAVLQDGEEDETDSRWNNVNGVEFRSIPKRRSTTKLQSTPSTTESTPTTASILPPKLTKTKVTKVKKSKASPVTDGMHLK